MRMSAVSDDEDTVGSGGRDASPRSPCSGGAGWAHAALAAACLAGAALSVAGAAAPGIEWRVGVMAIVCFASASLSAEVRVAGRGQTIRIPLAQPALFASSLVLAPTTAALPGVSNGIARALLSPARRRPLHEVLYTIFAPAVICSAAAYVYRASGGSALRPYEVASTAPALLCALTYVAAGALLAAVSEGARCARSGQSSPVAPDVRLETERPPRLAVVVAAWAVCLFSGYVFSVVYALGPSYVLLVPAFAAAAAQAAIRLPRERESRAGRARAAPAESALSTDTRETTGFIDHSTGLANQRYLEMFMRKELSRAERTGSPVSVAAFDFEQFRRLVESGDAEAAEDALVEIARRIKHGVRDYDLVATYSPGRLIVVLPDIGVEGAMEVAERVHASLSGVKAGREQVRVDVGIAAYPEHGTTFEELINSSHHALNRGRAAEPGGVHGCHRLAQAS